MGEEAHGFPGDQVPFFGRTAASLDTEAGRPSSIVNEPACLTHPGCDMEEGCHKISCASIVRSMLTSTDGQCTLYLIVMGRKDDNVPDPSAGVKSGKSWLSQSYGETT